jgi:glucose-1-phosphate adenylyltransferase
MLAAGEKMFAYPFEGYWKDVGTISSLWEANMDLLGEKPELNLGDESWRIYARHMALSPQYVGADAVIENSNISEGCEIYGTVRNCIIGAGVKIEAGAVVCDSVLMGDTVIEADAQVSYSIIATGVTVGKGAKIGADKAEAKGIAVIGEDVTIEAGAVVEAGAMVPEV